jgi:hypothetical protein
MASIAGPYPGDDAGASEVARRVGRLDRAHVRELVEADQGGRLVDVGDRADEVRIERLAGDGARPRDQLRGAGEGRKLRGQRRRDRRRYVAEGGGGGVRGGRGRARQLLEVERIAARLLEQARPQRAHGVVATVALGLDRGRGVRRDAGQRREDRGQLADPRLAEGPQTPVRQRAEVVVEGVDEEAEGQVGLELHLRARPPPRGRRVPLGVRRLARIREPAAPAGDARSVRHRRPPAALDRRGATGTPPWRSFRRTSPSARARRSSRRPRFRSSAR